MKAGFPSSLNEFWRERCALTLHIPSYLCAMGNPVQQASLWVGQD